MLVGVDEKCRGWLKDSLSDGGGENESQRVCGRFCSEYLRYPKLGREREPGECVANFKDKQQRRGICKI